MAPRFQLPAFRPRSTSSHPPATLHITLICTCISHGSYVLALQQRVSRICMYTCQFYLTWLRSAPFAHSLRTFFFNLPVLVFGSSSTISTSRGTMNLLIPLLCLAHSITFCPSSAFPLCTVMKALGRSPQCESATATTAASRMSSCVANIDSSATDEIFSPPALFC